MLWIARVLHPCSPRNLPGRERRSESPSSVMELSSIKREKRPQRSLFATLLRSVIEQAPHAQRRGDAEGYMPEGTIVEASKGMNRRRSNGTEDRLFVR